MKKRLFLYLMIFMSLFMVVGCGTKKKTPEDNLKITKTEAKKIKYEKYDNGLISLDIPEGWKVTVPSKVTYSSYTFKVYNPDNPDYTFLFGLKFSGFLKSEEARQLYFNLYPTADFGNLAAIDPQTTEAFYKVWSQNAKYSNTTQLHQEYFPYLDNFEVIENFGQSPLGGDILRATFTNKSGDKLQGLFTTTIMDSGSYYIYGKDVWPLSAYHNVMMYAPDTDFINWQEIYEHCLGTLIFSEEFIKGFNREEATEVAVVQANAKVYDEISDMIMDSWEKRNNSYDIISQKQSDATLGYERVYDTDTGEVYRAYNGFTDSYDGSKYKPVTDDMYSYTISGYIEK